MVAGSVAPPFCTQQHSAAHAQNGEEEVPEWKRESRLGKGDVTAELFKASPLLLLVFCLPPLATSGELYSNCAGDRRRKRRQRG